ncbi:serine/threonine-protein kinase [Nocardia vermiculata]|uniref:non-specific serine/threonine protein kinase n=1 Tax=Nocardia vermiculata TaxID=257274 RepID=A0A846XS45_9NOCA|nr:serine/threonine-protein kinase [Nocardia vermiculata]NKY48912.1 protein kinase [Nocardia vermiculata]
MVDLRAEEVFAGYRIQGVLGRGGMGTVYLAHHPRLPRLTALKLLDPGLFADAEIRARFEREADVVARLDHPNIVTVHDRGQEGTFLWIAMQYVAGVDAASLGIVDANRAVRIITETAAALDHAHRHGVLHRDVKPANILLANAYSGEPERVLLADFGIARLRDDVGGLTRTGTFTATLAFAAPEQLAGGPVDHHCDQYSLACTLFGLLTGSAPFAATNPVALIEASMRQPPPPLSGRRPDIPPAVDAVLSRALAKRPDDRFASCSEFAAAVSEALATVGASAQTMVPIGVSRLQQSPLPAPPTVAQQWAPPPVYGQGYPAPQSNPSPVPPVVMKRIVRTKVSRRRLWILITVPAFTVFLVAVTGGIVYRNSQPTYPTVSKSPDDVTSVFPSALSASVDECTPKTTDTDNQNNGRMDVVTVSCQILRPASLSSYPESLFAGILDARIDSGQSRDVMSKNKGSTDTDYRFRSSDKSAEIFINNNTQASYRSARTLLVINFGFRKTVTADQLKAFLNATGLF